MQNIWKYLDTTITLIMSINHSEKNLAQPSETTTTKNDIIEDKDEYI